MGWDAINRNRRHRTERRVRDAILSLVGNTDKIFCASDLRFNPPLSRTAVNRALDRLWESGKLNRQMLGRAYIYQRTEKPLA